MASWALYVFLASLLSASGARVRSYDVLATSSLPKDWTEKTPYVCMQKWKDSGNKFEDKFCLVKYIQSLGGDTVKYASDIHLCARGQTMKVCELKGEGNDLRLSYTSKKAVAKACFRSTVSSSDYVVLEAAVDASTCKATSGGEIGEALIPITTSTTTTTTTATTAATTTTTTMAATTTTTTSTTSTTTVATTTAITTTATTTVATMVTTTMTTTMATTATTTMVTTTTIATTTVTTTTTTTVTTMVTTTATTTTTMATITSTATASEEVRLESEIDEEAEKAKTVDALSLFTEEGYWELYHEKQKQIKCCVSSVGHPTQMQDLNAEILPKARARVMADEKGCGYMFGNTYHNGLKPYGARTESTCVASVAEIMEASGLELAEVLALKLPEVHGTSA